mmetsp:Transcript_7088/g.20000  ORF Transcript_7088/g.20000 Transcript_7088/m.20000 type:complete len:214 (+) Transcript_7088:1170-1811(+)
MPPCLSLQPLLLCQLHSIGLLCLPPCLSFPLPRPPLCLLLLPLLGKALLPEPRLLPLPLLLAGLLQARSAPGGRQRLRWRGGGGHGRAGAAGPRAPSSCGVRPAVGPRDRLSPALRGQRLGSGQQLRSATRGSPAPTQGSPACAPVARVAGKYLTGVAWRRWEGGGRQGRAWDCDRQVMEGHGLLTIRLGYSMDRNIEFRQLRHHILPVGSQG